MESGILDNDALDDIRDILAAISHAFEDLVDGF